MTTKYYLRLKQGSDQYISPWKISKVIDDLAEEYYKKYLLNILVDRIPNLNKDEELIIFHGSFDMYNKYTDLKDFSINKRDDVLAMYYLGNPISFKPNIRVMKISLIFEMHRRIFTKLNSIDILMNRINMFDYIKPNFNDNTQFDLSRLRQYLAEVLSTEKKEHVKIKNDCYDIIEKFESKLSKFVEQEVEFNIIDSYKDEEDLKGYLKKSKKLNLYKKYFEAFEDTFSKLGRPLVGIFNIKKGTLEILAKDFVREDLQNANENKLEMVSLSKNSPTAMSYIVGTIVVPWLASLLVTSLEKKKIQKAKELDIPETATNPELLKLEEVIQEFKDAQEEINDIDDKVIHIEDYKVKKAILRMDYKITDNTEKTLRKNDFLNENIELKLVPPPEEGEEGGEEAEAEAAAAEAEAEAEAEINK